MGAEALEFVGAVEDRGGPGLGVEIPLHGFTEAGGVVLFRGPAEFGFDLRSVDGVAQVVAGAVGDEGDLVGVGFAVGTGAEFVEECAEEAH